MFSERRWRHLPVLVLGREDMRQSCLSLRCHSILSLSIFCCELIDHLRKIYPHLVASLALSVANWSHVAGRPSASYCSRWPLGTSPTCNRSVINLQSRCSSFVSWRLVDVVWWQAVIRLRVAPRAFWDIRIAAPAVVLYLHPLLLHFARVLAALLGARGFPASIGSLLLCGDPIGCGRCKMLSSAEQR